MDNILVFLNTYIVEKEENLRKERKEDTSTHFSGATVAPDELHFCIEKYRKSSKIYPTFSHYFSNILVLPMLSLLKWKKVEKRRKRKRTLYKCNLNLYSSTYRFLGSFILVLLTFVNRMIYY